MSYFQNNKLFTYYEVDKSVIGSGESLEKPIEIINNENIIFDLSKFVISTSSIGVLNSYDVETIKFIIDWGDGKKDKLSKPLISNRSTIGVYKQNDWKIVKHTFNVQNKTDQEKNITIIGYNSYNEKYTLKIPYTVLYKTLYDLGSEFSMFSANTTNKNDVSYTLKQLSTDSLMVLRSLTEKDKLYGLSKEDNKLSNISNIYSDEFINEDFMVWDWNTLPTIIFNDVTVSENTITCSFINEGIELEKWYPQMKLLNDLGDKDYLPNKIDDTFSFNCEIDDYGIYEIYLNPITGMNGTKGKSNSKYYKHCPIIADPKHIRNIMDKSPIVIGQNIKNGDRDSNKITFNFTLIQPFQLKHLTKLNLILEAYVVGSNKNIQAVNEIRFVHDVLSTLFDDKGNPKYIKNLDANDPNLVQSEHMNFSYSIRMKDIPNKIQIRDKYYDIGYKVYVETNDILDNGDNSIFYFYDDKGQLKQLTVLEGEGIIEDKQSNGNTRLSFTYEIGSFGQQEENTFEQDQIKKTFDLKWKFDPKDEWEKFTVQCTDSDGNLIINDTHSYHNGSFIGLKMLDDNTFVKTLDGNKIPNDDLTYKITYKSEMGDYYDSREVSHTIQQTYRYKRPRLKVCDIQPYITIDYNQLYNSQNLKLNLQVTGKTINETGEEIKEKLKSISIERDRKSLQNLYTLNYIDRLNSFDAATYNYNFKAYNYNDLHNRPSEENMAKFTIGTNVSQLSDLPYDGVDYLNGTVESQFDLLDEKNDEGDYKKVDWLWVKQNTLHDIDKYYKYVSADNDVVYFGHQYNDDFSFDGETRHVLYDIVTINREGEISRRFRPIILDNETFSTYDQIALETAEDILYPTSISTSITKPSCTYVKEQDRFTIKIKWNEALKWEYVKNAWLELYEVKTVKTQVEDQGEIIETEEKVETFVQRVSIMNKNEYIFEKVPFGIYKYKIILNSEEVKTDDNTYSSTYEMEGKITETEALEVLSESIIDGGEDSGDNQYVYYTIYWKLNHKSCEFAKFLYALTKKEEIKNDKGEPELDANGNPTYKHVLDGTVYEIDAKELSAYQMRLRADRYVIWGFAINKTDNVIAPSEDKSIKEILGITDAENEMLLRYSVVDLSNKKTQQ